MKSNRKKKHLNYGTREVSSVPKNAEHYELEHLEGGHIDFYLLNKEGACALYVGGGSESEPIFLVTETFGTRREAMLYAQYLTLTMF